MMKNAWRSPGIGAALMLLLTVLVYRPALRAGFIWDDDAYVTQNSLLTAPDGLQRIWFSAHRQSQYFPLVYTTLRFEHRLWGLNPLGYHLVNVLLHGMNALLIWAVLRRLALPGAWLAALIWAVHPVNVESVAWVTELKNTQSTLFYLLALLAWIKFTDEQTARPWWFYALALLFQVLALLSKTTACTLPVTMLLVLWLRRQPIGWHRLGQVAPFVVCGIAMGLLSVWWEGHLGNHGEKFGFTFNPLERLLIATHAVWFYAGKLVWPVDLTFSYARWEINAGDPLQYRWLIGCVAVAVLLWWRRNSWGRPPVAAVVFFVATLTPMLGFAFTYTFRYTFVADHYQYLASIGLIAMVTGMGTLTARRAGQWGRYAGAFAAAVLLLILTGATWSQEHAYSDLETLWRDTLEKNPSSWLAHNNLGAALVEAGRLQEAIGQYEQALRIKPDYAEAHNNVGVALARLGKVQEAVEHFEQALQLNSDYANVHYNLGLALARLDRLPEAIAHWELTLQIKPDFAEAHYNLGVALVRLGKLQEAVGHWEQALRLDPDDFETQYKLGSTLLTLGKAQEAVGHFEQALKRRPDYAEAHYNLGVALEQTGKVQDAIRHYEQALRLNPNFAAAQNDLARLRTAP